MNVFGRHFCLFISRIYSILNYMGSSYFFDNLNTLLEWGDYGATSGYSGVRSKVLRVPDACG